MNQLDMDLQAVGEKWFLQINEMDEFRNEAYDNAKIYKERTKAWHDKHISWKEYFLGQQVLFFNSWLRLFPDKLKLWWSVSFMVVKVFYFGVVEVSYDEKEPFTVNDSA